jgi:hypothetical protein
MNLLWYFDDIVIYSNDLKTQLGHVVNGETTKMQYEKLKAILEWPKPTNCKNIEEFRGIAGYYRQYIKRFSDQMKPLNERLRKKEFRWSSEENEAFEKVKESYRLNLILIIHDFEKQTWMHADASDYAIGAGISQLDSNGKRRPVLFYSRKLLPAEMNYSTPGKEMLAYNEEVPALPKRNKIPSDSQIRSSKSKDIYDY